MLSLSPTMFYEKSHLIHNPGSQCAWLTFSDFFSIVGSGIDIFQVKLPKSCALVVISGVQNPQHDSLDFILGST